MWRKHFSQLLLPFLERIPKQFPNSTSRFCRHSSTSCQLEVTQVKSRSLIRLRGAESLPLLQGLLTNDVAHLETKSSFYTLLLNHQGRVLFDAIVYKSPSDEDSVLLECDSAFRSKLVSHLKLYRLKRKVEIEAEDKLAVWVAYDAAHLSGSKREDFPAKVLDISNVTHFGDPRLAELGWRIFGPAEINTEQLFPGISSSQNISVKDSEEGYKALKYTLGVGEGVVDIPFGNSFPLEANGDYLHGISFHKGCYLGQELTARTHHTGVVRKRLMPFRLTTAIDDKILGDVQSIQILNGKKRPVGKVRGLHGNLGIALFRVEETLSASTLTLNDTLITVSKPSWWPVEASKDISLGRK
ncbi:putative transferase CAF17 homolog, mitochondrial isoform X2 [Folsomia candida]|uniref:putative transferase CAF17 homolog, mitochondrial isoform X2 n=1 Tax=Folsomia candida TaxID=158441 RepID=UPI000B9079E4|nr:putative transferase CAF17 homolog, mitochondrial isoform X2 [Folsomia candida]